MMIPTSHSHSEMAKFPLTAGMYEVQYPIGKGGYSWVFQGRHMRTREIVALKFVSRDGLSDITFLENFEKELRIFERIKHKGITKHIETIYLEKYIVIVQELLPSGTLMNAVKPYSMLHDDVILRWAREILETIQYLHENGISHCDIKPENIGLDINYHAKMFDFGLCSDQTRVKQQKCGTPLFAAPEIFTQEEHDDFKADIWSYGVTIHYIATGAFPFLADDLKSFVRSIRKPNFIQNRCTGPLGQLVNACLQLNPNNRMTAKEILGTHIFDTAEKCSDEIEQNISLAESRSKSLYKKPAKVIIVPKVRTISSRIRPSFSI